MSLNRVTSSQVKDSETRAYCNELVSLIADSEDWDIEQALNIHNQLDTYMGESLKHNQSFYSESELEFLIAFLAKLSTIFDSEKQKLAIEIIKKQKSKGAVSKYKSNI
ncbi:hypothetical protein [Pseudoalteromonas sp. meg-B1]|uniref:hypothetical protein n=1 Tax=Pseudoalteromonas sp. meg-B1 TaxID=2203192 RepID=UPI000D6FB455|nr:hypothetical protein [Pseudoalteromonas sp. meg-B1]PWS55663.1 hypothetical protein DK924_02525 [Pseudoalteromonas sp. meg-B1]